MTKQEYMNTLRDKLNIFDEALIKEIIEDYESHFAEGVENGKSEEYVSNELGEIDEIVAELELLYKTLPKKQMPVNTLDTVNINDIPNNEFQVICTHIIEMADDNKVLLSVNDASEVDKYSEQAEQTYTKKSGSNSIPVKKLILESDCAQVNIKPSSDNNFSLFYNNEGSMKQKMMYRFYGDQKGDTFYGRVFRENGVGKFFNFSFQPDIVIDVYLPKNMDLVEIKGVSGDIESRGVSADEIKINTSSGEIIIEHSNCKNIDISSLSGSIEAYSINCGYISLVCKNGDVSVRDVLINKSIIKSLSGNIDIRNLKGLDVYADTASGDIEIMDIAAEDVKLNSTSGDISFCKGTTKSLTPKSVSGDVSVNNIITERIDAETISGDVELNAKANIINSKSTAGDISIVNKGILQGEFNSISGDIDIRISSASNGYKASVNTLSGDIELRLLSDNYCRQHRNGIYTIGNGASHVKVKTMSGDICISD